MSAGNHGCGGEAIGAQVLLGVGEDRAVGGAQRLLDLGDGQGGRGPDRHVEVEEVGPVRLHHRALAEVGRGRQQRDRGLPVLDDLDPDRGAPEARLDDEGALERRLLRRGQQGALQARHAGRLHHAAERELVHAQRGRRHGAAGGLEPEQLEQRLRAARLAEATMEAAQDRAGLEQLAAAEATLQVEATALLGADPQLEPLRPRRHAVALDEGAGLEVVGHGYHWSVRDQ